MIGIGNIDADEINGIASEKKEYHAHLVTSYNALMAITNTVINDTCLAGE